MKSQSLLMLLAATGLTAASCGKKNEGSNPPAAKTRTEMLTGGNWRTIDKLNVITTTPPGGPATVDSEKHNPNAPACEKDDLTLFKTDGTLILDEGAIKCDPNHAQTTNSGNWMLTDNETRIRFYDQSGSSSFKIDELTEARLKLSIDTSATISGSAARLQGYVIFANP